MPYFQVMLHGDGIHIPIVDPKMPAIGFYATRIVWAKDETAARVAACAMIQGQWLAPEYKSNNSGGRPQLSVESVQRSSFMAWLRFRNTGHSFYGPENEVA